jgi:Cu+-exporting ATPase
MVERSTHPLSNRINQWLGKVEASKLDRISEIKGSGIEAVYKNQVIRVGSQEFTEAAQNRPLANGNHVFLSVGGIALGNFHIQSGLRQSVPEVIQKLSREFKLHVLSGDQAHEREVLSRQLGADIKFTFDQKPLDKLRYLKALDSSGHNTVMVGDGLNDAGALQESQVGIALTDRISHFSPASDAILDAASFDKIPSFLAFARSSRKIIKASFALSILYNIVGISLAVQGLLSPVLCAILMPLSSISVVVFTTLATNFMGVRTGLLQLNKP